MHVSKLLGRANPTQLVSKWASQHIVQIRAFFAWNDAGHPRNPMAIPSGHDLTKKINL